MPSTCPHGNPIPGMAAPLKRVAPFPLAQARVGASVVVERITEEAEADKNLLEHLWRHNVRPGRRLKITEVAPWAGTITAAETGRPSPSACRRRRRSGSTCRKTRRERPAHGGPTLM